MIKNYKMKRKSLMVIGSLLLIMVFSSTGVIAGLVPGGVPVYVTGKVLDQDNNGLSCAEVNATCNGTTKGPIYTQVDGSYTFDFTDTTCGVGDTAYVDASYGGQTGSDSGIVYPWGFAHVAVVIITLSIPEFATAAIPVVLALCSYLVIRRKR